MDLQSLFYLVAIVFMLMFIVSFLFLGYFLWRLERVLKELPANTMNRVKGFVEEHTSGLSGTIGLAIFTFILNHIKRRFSKDA
ncbi:MAG: hypothetical protein RI947_1523 [Candidatus Parcubacteria bacterium]|jgi:hypothetical protein